MTIIPLEVQTEVSVDGMYDVQVLQDEIVDIGLGEAVVIQARDYTAGNGIVIYNHEISIDPELIIDCGTSTTVLYGGVT